MGKLFEVKGIEFYEKDFVEEIQDYEDIIAIIQELSPDLDYEIIEVAGDNGCCDKTKKNYLVEIIGYLNKDDEFITKEERDTIGILENNDNFDLFVITIHKCTACNKWTISLLED